MDDEERKARDQQLRSSIHTKLVESGEYDRLKEMLKQKLVDSGWREDLKQYTMNLIRTKGDEQLSVEQLTQEITPQGRATVPDEVKAELLTRIRRFVEEQAV